MQPDQTLEPPPVRSLVFTGALLGIGIGGFFDGIVFHQLLQWHHMLTGWQDYAPTSVANLEANTLWDGIFHAATWIATVSGLAMLWALDRRFDVRWSMVLLGSLLTGWGGFNLTEGIVDHHLLGVHHVRDDLGGPLEWDLGFLVWGVVFFATGVALIRAGARKAERALREHGR
jgi:uncharacterized membrane protein